MYQKYSVAIGGQVRLKGLGMVSRCHGIDSHGHRLASGGQALCTEIV